MSPWWLIAGFLCGGIVATIYWLIVIVRMQRHFEAMFVENVNQTIAEFFGGTVRDGIIYIEDSSSQKKQGEPN